MDKNNQNKSSNGDYLRILLEPIGTLTHSTVLTIEADKLKALGIDNHLVSGVTWCSDGNPISYGILTYDKADYIADQIDTILNASIVNADQRKAVSHLIHEVIRTQQFNATDWVYRRTSEVVNSAESTSDEDGVQIYTKSY